MSINLWNIKKVGTINEIRLFLVTSFANKKIARKEIVHVVDPKTKFNIASLKPNLRSR